MKRKIIVMSEYVYFELNNWFAGRNYPNEEPFKSWCGNDLNLYFLNEDWVKENKLVVVADSIDMSIDWCITAPKEWVENNCPKLLSDESTYVMINGSNGPFQEEYKYSSFLRYPNKYGDICGIFGTPFLEYSEENIGIHFYDEENEE